MPETVLGIREILAQNLKANRRRCGLTQEKLAEKAGISAHYLAMVEVSRKFPTPEMLERLAKALNIEAYKLFQMPASPEEALERLQETVAANIEQVVAKAIKETLAKEYNR